MRPVSRSRPCYPITKEQQEKESGTKTEPAEKQNLKRARARPQHAGGSAQSKEKKSGRTRL